MMWGKPPAAGPGEVCDPSNCLVDGEGSARGLDEAVVGGTLTADSGVLAGVLHSGSNTEDTDGDLLAVKTDGALKEVVEGKAETSEGVLGVLAGVLFGYKRRVKW